MRVSFIFVAVLVFGYVGLVAIDSTKALNDSFQMTNAGSPVQLGKLKELHRQDLFFPSDGPYDYSVPHEVTLMSRTTIQNGRTWHVYMHSSVTEPSATILLFHGAGRNGLSMIDMWRSVADVYSVRLIALDGIAKNWQAETVNPSILHEILEVEREASIVNDEPVYLFGHSNGGVYVQRLINRTVGPWRAAAIHAGFSAVEDGFFPIEPKPIRFYIGTRDHIFKPDAVRTVAQRLARNGHNVDLHLIPNHNHWFYSSGAKIAEDAWKWLSKF